MPTLKSTSLGKICERFSRLRPNSSRTTVDDGAELLPTSLKRPSVPASIAGDGHYIEWLEVRKGKDGKLFRPARRDNAVRCLKAGLAYASRVTDDSQDMAQFKQGIEKIFIIWRLSTFLAWQVASSGEAPRQRLESKRFMYHKAIATWPMRKTSPTKRLLNCSNYFQSRVSLVRKPTARTS